MTENEGEATPSLKLRRAKKEKEGKEMYSRLQNKGGRRQNFQVPRKTAKMSIGNTQTIVAIAEENYLSWTEHFFAVAAGRKF